MTLPLPRPNVQINPGRQGPPRLTPKEQKALAEITDPVLRRTLGEMFLTARGNQENFDELAQQFPIQPHNAADAITEQLPGEGEEGQGLILGPEGPEWGDVGEAAGVLEPGLPPDIVEFAFAGEALELNKLIETFGPARLVGVIMGAFKGPNEAFGGTGFYAGPAMNTDRFGSFRTGAAGVDTQLKTYGIENPAFAMGQSNLRITRLATFAKITTKGIMFRLALPSNSLTYAEKQTTTAAVKNPSSEVTIPSRCSYAFSCLVVNGGEVSPRPTAFSDTHVARIEIAPPGGYIDVQFIHNPPEGKHTFEWTLPEAKAVAIISSTFKYN